MFKKTQKNKSTGLWAKISSIVAIIQLIMMAVKKLKAVKRNKTK